MQRRHFIGAGAALGATTLAGCSLLSERSESNRDDLPSVESWIPGVEEGSDTSTNFNLRVRFHERVFDDADRVPSEILEHFDNETLPGGRPPVSGNRLGFTLHNDDPTVPIQWYKVTTGEFDRDEIAGPLRDDGFELDGTYGDFQLFFDREVQWAAVADGRVVWGWVFRKIGRDGVRSLLETIRATASGDRPGLHEQSALLGTALDRVPAADEISVARIPPEDDSMDRYLAGIQVFSQARTYRFDDAEHVFSLLFESESAAEATDVEGFLSHHVSDDQNPETEFTVDGNYGEISVSGSYEDVF